MTLRTQNIFLIVCILLFVKSCCATVEEGALVNEADAGFSSSINAPGTTKLEEISKDLSIALNDSNLTETTTVLSKGELLFESNNESNGSHNGFSSMERQDLDIIKPSIKTPFVMILPSQVETNNSNSISTVPPKYGQIPVFSSSSPKPEENRNLSETNGTQSKSTTVLGNGTTIMENYTIGTCDTDSAQTNYSLKVHPDNTNCSNYYEMCVHMESNHHPAEVIKSCPPEQLFDSIYLRCMSAQLTYCGDYVCNELDGFYPDPKTQGKFIHCFDGKPTRKECEPVGTIFDKELQICIRVPEELPIGLKLLKAFIWFVKITGPHQNATEPKHQGDLETAEDYAIATLVALLIPLTYMLIAIVLYKMIHKFPEDDMDPFVSDADEFQRYRPACTSASTLQLLSLHPSPVAGDEIVDDVNNGHHYATTRF